MSCFKEWTAIRGALSALKLVEVHSQSPGHSELCSSKMAQHEPICQQPVTFQIRRKPDVHPILNPFNHQRRKPLSHPCTQLVAAMLQYARQPHCSSLSSRRASKGIAGAVTARCSFALRSNDCAGHSHIVVPPLLTHE